MKAEEAKITSKGQVTIPKTVREKLDLVEGMKVVFIIHGNEVILRPKIKNAMKELERIRKEVPLFSEEEIRRIIEESKKEWSKFQ